MLGSFLSWLGSLTTYAIGEAAERAELNGEELYELKHRLGKLEAAAQAGGTQAAQTGGRPRASGAPAAAAAFTADGKWRCRKCGSMNDKSSIFCKDCGEYR